MSDLWEQPSHQHFSSHESSAFDREQGSTSGQAPFENLIARLEASIQRLDDLSAQADDALERSSEAAAEKIPEEASEETPDKEPEKAPFEDLIARLEASVQQIDSARAVDSFQYDILPDAYLAPIDTIDTASSPSTSLDSLADSASVGSLASLVEKLPTDSASLLLPVMPSFTTTCDHSRALDESPRLPIGIENVPHNPIPHQELPSTATRRVALQHQATRVRPTPLGQVPLQAIETRAPKAQPLRRIALGGKSAQLPPLKNTSSSTCSRSTTLFGGPARANASHECAPAEDQVEVKRTKRSAIGFTAAPNEPSAKRPMPPLPGSAVVLHAAPLSSGRIEPLKPMKRTSQDARKHPEPLFKTGSDSAIARPLWPSKREAQARSARDASTLRDLQQPLGREAHRSTSLLAEQRLPMQGQQVELHPIPAVQQPIRTRTSRHAKR